MGKDGRWRFGARGKSELHRARVPGESQGDARVTGRRQSRLARGLPRESNRDQNRFTGVKRVILPAAISESAASRLLAEAGSREPPRRRRRGRVLLGPREMTIGNRTRLTLPPLLHHGAYSSIGRALVCGTRGHGFEPRKAPHREPAYLRRFSFTRN